MTSAFLKAKATVGVTTKTDEAGIGQPVPASLLVRKARFELARPFGHHGLSMTRLPIPSHAHIGGPGWM